MSTQFMLIFSVRLLLCWLLLSVLVFVFREQVALALLPIFNLAANIFSDGYVAKILLAEGEKGAVLQINALVAQDMYRQNIAIAPAGTVIKAGGTLIHGLVPLVLYLVALLSWPARLKVTSLALLLSIPVLLCVLVFTEVTLLVGQVEAIIFNAASNVSAKPLSEPFIMRWLVFVEVGGRWVIPLVAAAVCLIFSFGLLSSRATPLRNSVGL